MSPDRRRAAGRRPADLVVTNGRLLNAATGEVLEADVAIAGRWIVAIGDCAYSVGPNTRIIDAAQRVGSAGLIDAHFHIEGSMVTVRELARSCCHVVSPR